MNSEKVLDMGRYYPPAKYARNFFDAQLVGCVEVAAPYKLHAAKIARSSRADIIRPCTIVTICNIVMVVYHQHLHLQIPIANHAL